MLRTIVPLGLFAFALLGAVPVLSGTFALQNSIPKTSGQLIARTVPSEPLERNLNFWMVPNGSSAIVRRYDIDMTKLLHFVIVSDDFRTFMHVHPSFAGGHFVLTQRFPRPALYHVYADGEPSGIGQQVFRFDLAVGSPRLHVKRELGPKGTSTSAGPYVVLFDRATLSTSGESKLTIHIRKNGHPARDLHPYLGALAHVVLLDADDLTYVHAHPMPLRATTMKPPSGNASMSGDRALEMAMPALAARTVTTPDMFVQVAVHKPGPYQLWLQFRGGGSLHVARLLLTATNGRN
ncbi:MAG: hypothetical protein M3R44_07335 [Candidatus Eremiobacteraeota bacterium]|nr:hypothetical protein [Candidatus Eremiobacteraeota bacterium]